MNPTPDSIHETVRDHYARAVLNVMDESTASCCGGSVDSCGCGDGCCSASANTGESLALYSELEKTQVPDAAVLASMGCGNPTAVAELREGERVLDLGSGGGIDVLISARRVGPSGRVFGLDMTDEMLALAQKNAAEAGADNVEFLKGMIEAVPLPASSVDVVISNCVINLAADKQAVFREIHRVLKPGGRVGVTDIVADDGLTPEQRAKQGSYAGCIAGALSFAEFKKGLSEVGLTDVSISPTHSVVPGMYSAIVKATKPRKAPALQAAAHPAAAPLVPAGS
jgi:arsenite methyltransferase